MEVRRVPAVWYLYTNQCRLCDDIFEENISIACEHLMFCRECFRSYGLSDSMGLVCTRCSLVSVRRNQQWDSQQDILSLMHLRAKYRRGICHESAVNVLCQELDEVLNITGTKPCGDNCMTCSMLTLTNIESIALAKFGPYGNIVIGPNRNIEPVEGKFTCKSKNVIYFIYCRRQECRQAYVGQTTGPLHVRMDSHRFNILQGGTTSLYKHFRSSYHTVRDCKVCVIKGYPAGTVNLKNVLKNEEKRLIKLLGTKIHGLNMV